MIIVCACLYMLGAFAVWCMIVENDPGDNLNWLVSLFWPIFIFLSMIIMAVDSLKEVFKKHKNVKQKQTNSKSRRT